MHNLILKNNFSHTHVHTLADTHCMFTFCNSVQFEMHLFFTILRICVRTRCVSCLLFCYLFHRSMQKKEVAAQQSRALNRMFKSENGVNAEKRWAEHNSPHVCAHGKEGEREHIWLVSFYGKLASSKQQQASRKKEADSAEKTGSVYALTLL